LGKVIERVGLGSFGQELREREATDMTGAAVGNTDSLVGGSYDREAGVDAVIFREVVAISTRVKHDHGYISRGVIVPYLRRRIEMDMVISREDL
jgi:hypothetical protein